MSHENIHTDDNEHLPVGFNHSEKRSHRYYRHLSYTSTLTHEEWNTAFILFVNRAFLLLDKTSLEHGY
jgi:hypothetical protein